MNSATRQGDPYLFHSQRHQIQCEACDESSIFEAANVKCTRALTYPSLITMLCKMAGVRMSETKEKSPRITSLPLSKSKTGSRFLRHDQDNDNEDSEEEDEEEGEQE